MKYILLILVSTFGANGGISITSAEFDSKVACEDAGKKVQKDFKTFFTQEPKIICIPKATLPGDQKP